MSSSDAEGSVHPVRRPVSEADSRRANRRDWDAYADEYQASHGDFLGDAGFVWGPEGLTEAEARVLGDVAGRRVLEVGCGAAQSARWLVRQGARVTAFDVSAGQLREARRLDVRSGTAVPRLVQADAQRLPFRDGAFDVVVSTIGAVFAPDQEAVAREMTRVCRPGGVVAVRDGEGEGVDLEHLGFVVGAEVDVVVPGG